MQLTVLSTQLNCVEIRVIWDSRIGKCTVWIGERRHHFHTLFGKLKRKVQLTFEDMSLTVVFVPFNNNLNNNRIGLFLIKKNQLIYKATSWSLQTYKPVKISDLPLSQWR